MMAKTAPGDQVSTTPASYPSKDIRVVGKHVTIVGISPSHAPAMFDATKGAANHPLFLHLFDGPYDDLAAYTASTERQAADNVTIFYTILLNNPSSSPHPSSSPEQTPVGRFALLNINPTHRTCEVGNVLFSPRLQRTPAATEAQFLLAEYAFSLGYRRYEWKCNSLNEPSKCAALRLGFTFEGLFRQHMIQRGRSRDTWWASIVDSEWVGIKVGFEKWLAEDNFDEEGRQRRRLQEFREG